MWIGGDRKKCSWTGWGFAYLKTGGVGWHNFRLSVSWYQVLFAFVFQVWTGRLLLWILPTQKCIFLGTLVKKAAGTPFSLANTKAYMCLINRDASWRLMCRTTAAGHIPGRQSYCTWFPIVKYSKRFISSSIIDGSISGLDENINGMQEIEYQHARSFQGSLRSNCARLSRVSSYDPQDEGDKEPQIGCPAVFVWLSWEKGEKMDEEKDIHFSWKIRVCVVKVLLDAWVWYFWQQE